MPTHWTYDNYEPLADLYQGDIIARTEPLLRVLGAVHRHFCDEKYLAFLVTTQTCDLVLRKRQRCKAQHINLAVIRSLEDLIPGLFEEECGSAYKGIYRLEAQEEARKLLKRILDQNEQAHGLFYLHPDADVRIAVPAVSLLRVSIALRAAEHYAELRQARCGRLSTEYRNKLGWLTGNLYSRVDTTDWADHEGGDEEAKAIIAGFLDGSIMEQPNVWAPDSWIEAAKKKGVKIDASSKGEAYQALQVHAPPPPRETVIGRIRANASKAQSELGDLQLEDLANKLGDDRLCRMIVADHLFELAAAAGFPLNPAGQAGLRDSGAVRAGVATSLAEVVARFKAHRGPHDLSTFLEYYSKTPLLPPAACDHAASIIAPKAGDGSRPVGGLVDPLRAALPPDILIDYVRRVGIEAINSAFLDKFIARMENDAALKAALK